MFSLWDPQGAENWGYRDDAAAGPRWPHDRHRPRQVLGGSQRRQRDDLYSRQSPRLRWLGANSATGLELRRGAARTSKSRRPTTDRCRPYHGDNGPLSVIDMQTPSIGLARLRRGGGDAGRRAEIQRLQRRLAGGRRRLLPVDPRRRRRSRRPRPPRSSARSSGGRTSDCCTGVRATAHRRRAGPRSRRRPTRRADGVQTLRAEREVILCAGAYETPKLMLLSGLGPAAQVCRRWAFRWYAICPASAPTCRTTAAGCRLRMSRAAGLRRDAGGGRPVHLDRVGPRRRLAGPAVLLRPDPVRA